MLNLTKPTKIIIGVVGIVAIIGTVFMFHVASQDYSKKEKES